MKYLLILFSLLPMAYGQNPKNIDTSKLSKVLCLGDVELKIENVTERESVARGLPLKSAWIVSVSGHPLFFPLIIYTSEEGVINDNSIEELRKSLQESQKSNNDISKQFGAFNVSGVGECIVFLDELRISSNKPEGVEGVIVPWRPNRKAALSIIGTVKEQKLDFQIALLFAEEDKIADFPEYKKILYGPDYPILKDVAADLIEAIIDSNILPVAVTSSKKPSSHVSEVKSSKDLTRKTYGVWIFAGFFLFGLSYFIWKRSKKQNKRE